VEWFLSIAVAHRDYYCFCDNINLSSLQAHTPHEDDNDKHALFEAGVISGMGNKHFNPQGNGTRAEVATMPRNFMEAVQFRPFAVGVDDYAMLRNEDLYYDRREEDEPDESSESNGETDNS